MLVFHRNFNRRPHSFSKFLPSRVHAFSTLGIQSFLCFFVPKSLFFAVEDSGKEVKDCSNPFWFEGKKVISNFKLLYSTLK